MYKCHNCGIAMGLSQLIHHVAPPLKREYVLEKFGTRKKPSASAKAKEVSTDFFKTNDIPTFADNPLKYLTSVDKLAPEHPARSYVENRLIPSQQHTRLYYTDSFQAWTNSIVKDKFKKIVKDEGRLVIPFFDKEGHMIAFQGRSLDKHNPLRYITIKVTEDECKLFGLDTIDESRPVYVVEGPLDSLFIENSIAMAGSDLSANSCLNSDTELVIVMDNECRNIEIVKKIEAFIEKGYSVSIWSDRVLEKDINDMVLSGMSVEEVNFEIKCRTFKGLQAKMALNKWKRV